MGVNKGDVIGVNKDSIAAVNIHADNAIVVKVEDANLIPKICYEIRNKHDTLF